MLYAWLFGLFLLAEDRIFWIPGSEVIGDSIRRGPLNTCGRRVMGYLGGLNYGAQD